jgi:hypothetical protein
MKSDKPNDLLKEILAGDELADFRHASLEQGLSVIRRQQRQRRGLRFSVLLMLPLLLTFAILSRRSPEVSNRQIASTIPTTAANPAQPTDGRDVKFITDEELFALFPNRPLALVGKPGQQQLVFLDRAKSSRNQ